MLMERTWRKRLILNFVILIVWIMDFAALLYLTSNNPEQLTGLVIILGSALLILIYSFAIKYIMKFDWTLNEKQFSVLKLLLWLMYLIFAFNLYLVIQLLGIDFFISDTNTLITDIGTYGTLLLVVTLGVLFNRWHMAFNSLEYEGNLGN